jgi:hypothetical protein
LVFIDEGEDTIMISDVVMLSNPLVMLVKGEELEETLFNMNVSQRSCEEEPSKKVVRIQINNSTWDR